jgi:hypothetical protein
LMRILRQIVASKTLFMRARFKILAQG